MINTALILGGIALVIFTGVIVGFVGASVYDAWYQHKYRTWIALQDSDKPQLPAAK